MGTGPGVLGVGPGVNFSIKEGGGVGLIEKEGKV